jgi:hypothetical protein
MHGDAPTFDPIWTTANMAAYHENMVYDTLFGIDETSSRSRRWWADTGCRTTSSR